MCRFIISFYKKYGDKINAKIDAEKEQLIKQSEELKAVLKDVSAEWEKTKKSEERQGKTYATYDPELTKKKLKLTAKIEKKERAVSHKKTILQKKTGRRAGILVEEGNQGACGRKTRCDFLEKNRAGTKSRRVSFDLVGRTKAAYRHRKGACNESQSHAF
ncbi:MAG: hypothetical protein L6V85_03685 [Clostridiales bacterium]|nr:MAG: hypothetical protein L6V85_03685 [Clostridiales bacterium]